MRDLVPDTTTTLCLSHPKHAQAGPKYGTLQVRWLQRELIRLLTEATTIYDVMEEIDSPNLRAHLDSATDLCLQAIEELGQLEAGLNDMSIKKQVESA